MKQFSILLLLLFSFSLTLAAPTYWLATIPNGTPGSPIARQFQTLTNVPGTPFNVLFGGINFNPDGTNTSALNDTWILVPDTLAWKIVSDSISPEARAYSVAGAASNGEIILFGGCDVKQTRTFFDDLWRFNISSEVWTQDKYVVPTVLLARYGHAGVVVGDTLFIFGGFAKALQNVTNDVWAYNLTSKAWSLRSANGQPGSPRPRQGHSAVFYNDSMAGPSIIFFGGYNGTGGMSDTWQFVVNSSTWVQRTKDNDPLGPSPRSGHSAFLASSPSRMIIFGGTFIGGQINPYYNDVWSLSQNWTWTQLLPDGEIEGPWKRGGHSTVLSSGNSFTFGGYGLFVGLYNDLWQLIGY